MHYNLLYYGYNFGGCNSTSNNVNDKDNYLKTIIDYSLPDVLTVNELSADTIYADRLLNNVLNSSGRVYYKRAFQRNNAFSNIVNMIYFDSRKLEYHSQDFIRRDVNNSNLTRVIDVYKLYYKSPNLAIDNDTTFLYFFVLHAKAGSANSDLAARQRESEAIIDYIESNDLRENVFLSGDFNTKTSSEDSYLNLTFFPVENYRFYDPVNQPGSWADEAAFQHLHTQSTRVVSGCHAGGGLDDRFDFILISKPIIDNLKKVKYVNNSYKALGNDGIRLNQNLNVPPNTSAPNDVIEALYNFSDHLPVEIKIVVNINGVSSNLSLKKLDNIKLQNPIDNDFNIFIYPKNEEKLNVFVFNYLGQEVHQFLIEKHQNQVSESLNFLKSGVYLIRIADEKGNFFSQTIIKK
jgi:hypothetical protein